MKEACHTYIKVCPIWKDICIAPKGSKKHIKYRNGFLYVHNVNTYQRLVLPSTFNAKGKNFPEIIIAEAHAATTHDGIENIMTSLTNKFEYQSFYGLVKEHVRRSNICQITQQLQKGHIRYITLLHVPIIPWSDITKGFLKFHQTSQNVLSCRRILLQIKLIQFVFQDFG